VPSDRAASRSESVSKGGRSEARQHGAQPGPAARRTGATVAAGPYVVSCIMPAYNECDGIREAVRRVQRALEELTTGFEIIAVDDGSIDGTGRILDGMVDSTLRVVHLATNRGYGHALRAGFAAALHPLVFFTDSDDQFDPMDLRRLLPLIAEA